VLQAAAYEVELLYPLPHGRGFIKERRDL